MKLQFDQNDVRAALAAYAGVAPEAVTLAAGIDGEIMVIATAEAPAVPRRRRSRAAAASGSGMAKDMTDKPRRGRKPKAAAAVEPGQDGAL